MILCFFSLMHAPHSLPWSDGKTPVELAIEGNKRDVVALREWHWVSVFSRHDVAIRITRLHYDAAAVADGDAISYSILTTWEKQATVFEIAGSLQQSQHL